MAIAQKQIASGGASNGQVMIFNSTSGEWESASLPAASIFGENWTPAKDDSESSTSLTAFQEKLKLTTPSLSAGTYKIEWQCQLRTSNSGRQVTMQVELNDTTQLTQAMWAETDDLQISGHDHQVLGAGIHTIDIDFRAEAGPSRTATISDVRIYIYRVV